MNRRETFDDALDAAIDQIRGGGSLSDVLAAHPRHADALRPLLETSLRAHAFARHTTAPVPSGLADNFTIVRAALERERMAQHAAGSRRQPAGRTPWWQRRWGIASLSLPAGVFVFAMFAGASGAAAATVAVSDTDVVSRIAAAVTPGWAEQIVPEVLKNDDNGASNGGPRGGPHGGDLDPSAAGTNPTPNDTKQPDGQGAIPAVTLSGVVADISGNTFILTSADGDWKVQHDSKTSMSGTIAEGASATVTGAPTGEQALHATSITITATADGTPTPDQRPREPNPNAADPNDPPVGDNNGNPPADPGNGNDATPPGNNASSPVENSSDNANENSNAGSADEQGATGGNSPPGQGTGPSGGGDGQPNENAGGNSTAGGIGNGHAAQHGNSNNGNGGGPKKP